MIKWARVLFIIIISIGLFASPSVSYSTEGTTSTLEVISPKSKLQKPKNVSSSRYVFYELFDDGFPAHWNSCSPITWTYFKKDSPKNSKNIIISALQNISDATGLQFSYIDSGQNLAPKWDVINSRLEVGPIAQIQIIFGDKVNDPNLAPKSVAGDTQIGWKYSNLDGKKIMGEIYIAYVTIKKSLFTGTKPYSSNELKLLMMHELGHVVGLRHSPNKSDLMNANFSYLMKSFSIGDLNGLYKVGTSIPCTK